MNATLAVAGRTALVGAVIGTVFALTPMANGQAERSKALGAAAFVGGTTALGIGGGVLFGAVWGGEVLPMGEAVGGLGGGALAFAAGAGAAFLAIDGIKNLVVGGTKLPEV